MSCQFHILQEKEKIPVVNSSLITFATYVRALAVKKSTYFVKCLWFFAKTSDLLTKEAFFDLRLSTLNITPSRYIVLTSYVSC